VVAVEGSRGTGGASVVLALLAAATAAGEWAAVVDAEESFGALAAAEAGVALERLAVVRPGGRESRVPERWGTVVATLLESMTVVAVTVPRRMRPAEARRLVARAREQGAVLVAAGGWPGEAAVRLRAEASAWSGLGQGEGLLGARTLRVTVTGRGAAGRERTADVPLRAAS
jgi:hypothetical protein